MKTYYFAAMAVCLVGAVAVTGCSTTGSNKLDAGHRISERGAEISNRGQSWSDGQHDQRKGQKLVELSVDQVSDGENDLKKARAAVIKAEQRIEVAHANRTNGEKLVSSGTLKMQTAEADYAAIRDGPSAVDPN
jgi:hypothetical protein